MKTERLFLILAIAAVALLACFAGYESQQATDTLRVQVDGMVPAISTAPRQRIISLPDDGGAWHVSLIVNSDWRARGEQRELMSWFYSDPALASLRTQAHWHIYTTKSPIYTERLKASLGTAVPALLITNEQGKTVYRGSLRGQPADAGPSTAGYATIPGSPEELVGTLRGLFQRFKERNCPCPTPPAPPEPEPVEPDENEFVPINTQPDLGVDQEDDGAPWLLLALVVIASAGASLWINFRRDLNKG